MRKKDSLKDKSVAIGVKEEEESLLIKFDNSRVERWRKTLFSYPNDKVFLPGAFEMLEFEIKRKNNIYYFIIKIAADFKNEWDMPGGWDVQMFDIYLNLGKGVHKHTIKGRNVKIEEGWDKALLIAPQRRYNLKACIVEDNMDVFDSVTEEDNLVEDILVPDEVWTDKNKIIIKISQTKVGDLDAILKGIQVFCLGFNLNGVGVTYARKVSMYPSQWEFGGGSEKDTGPNVVDILGDNSSLLNYIADNISNEFATVKMLKVGE